jgi:hypothetical protein
MKTYIEQTCTKSSVKTALKISVRWFSWWQYTHCVIFMVKRLSTIAIHLPKLIMYCYQQTTLRKLPLWQYSKTWKTLMVYGVMAVKQLGPGTTWRLIQLNTSVMSSWHLIEATNTIYRFGTSFTYSYRWRSRNRRYQIRVAASTIHLFYAPLLENPPYILLSFLLDITFTVFHKSFIFRKQRTLM